MAMYKIIGGDQKEYGPVSAEEMRQWIHEGRLSTESLVLVEGGSAWQRLGELPEFASALQAQVRVSSAGAGYVASTHAGSWAAEMLGRRPEIQIGRCLSRSWTLLGENFGLLFSASFVVWLLGTLCQLTPWIGGMINLVVEGVLYGGLYLIFLNRIRGRPAKVGDVFAGFGLAFVQLMLAGLITGLLTGIGFVCCLVLPGIYLWVAWTFSVPLVADKRLEFWSAMELSRKTATRVWFELFALLAVSFLPLILVYGFVQIKVTYLLLPTMQHGMGSGPLDIPGMIRTMAEMMTQLATTNPLLLLLPKLVLLFNLPFALGAVMYAYEDLFGPRPTATA